MVKLIGIILFSALLGASQAQNTVLGAFPSQVGLQIVGNRFGEGVILNENHVLTVARNVFDANGLNRLNVTDITIVGAGVINIGANPIGLPINRIYAHENYNLHTGEFNVAVLRTVNFFLFPVDAVVPNIAPVTFNNRIIADGTPCNLVGWNLPPNALTQPLQSASLPVFNRNTCNLLDNPLIRGSVLDQHICAGVVAANTAVCNSNDGAGYYCDGQLVGLRTLGRQCGLVNSPAVIIQTRWFQSWIAEQFDRVDDPPSGPVVPPGVDRDDIAGDVVIGAYPAHVGLHIAGGRFGEGVIVNQNHVVTLASNVFALPPEINTRLGPGDITVSAGVINIAATPAGTLPVFRVYAHNHYNYHTGKFNVAVLRMTNNFDIQENLVAPPINFAHIHNRIAPEGSTCQLVDFVGTIGRALEVNNVPVFNRQSCNTVDDPMVRGFVYDQNICIGDTALTDLCGLNDGAAFYCDGELVGLLTRGMQCIANSPGVLVQARWFNTWIAQQFNRTDNPLPGVVPPPGMGVDGGASMAVLSALAVICVIAMNLLL